MRHVKILHTQIGKHETDLGSSVTFALAPGELLYGRADSAHTVTIVCGHCQRKTFYREASMDFQCGSCQRTYDVHGGQIG